MMTHADPFRLDDIERWMFDDALSLWIDAGQDKRDLGFVERLTNTGQTDDAGFKRMRVQARQIYVCSHAALLGKQKEAALAAAENGFQFATRNGWLKGGGWANKLGPAGGVLDATLNLYEQAFMLFALGWHLRVSGDHGALDLAHRTLDAVYTQLGRDSGKGFRSDNTGHTGLDQNPHMHLLEAMLVLYEVSGDARFHDVARNIIALVETCFFQADKGVLTEFFDADGQPMPGTHGRIVEPGHHFEWVWLLAEYRRVIGDDKSDLACRLFDFADARGIAPITGLVFDGVLDDGTLHDGSHRLWCQTEALKAHLVMPLHGRPMNEMRVQQIIGNILDRYLATDPRGLWIDHLDADGHATSSSVPASTLYHLFLAFSEVRRVLRP